MANLGIDLETANTPEIIKVNVAASGTAPEQELSQKAMDYLRHHRHLQSPKVHYAQAIPVVWAVLHGRLLAESLSGNSSAYDTLADIDTPASPGGQRLSLLLHRFGNLVGGIRSKLG